MSSWISKELGEVCKTSSGGTPLRSKTEYYKGNIPWIKSGELDKGIIYDSEEHISEEAVKKSSAKIFPTNTILIALYGATIGKLAILGVPATTNQAVCGIYQNSIFEPNFLFNYLFHKKQKLIEQGTGGAQPNISQTILKRLPVPIVPLPEQRAIVSKIEQLFSELDNGIANLKSAKEKLEVYRQSVLQKAFEGELTKVSMTKIPLKELMLNKPQNGLYKPNSEYGSGTKIIRIDGFYDGDILEHYEYQRVNLNNDEIEKYSIQEGNILVNRVNSMSHLGKCGLVSKINEPTVFESNIMKIDIDFSSAISFYIKYYLSSLKGREELTKNAKQAVNQASINQTDVGNTMVPHCLLNEQRQIVQEIESRLLVADKLSESIIESLDKSEALRQSILKKAFSGELLTEKELEACMQEADWEPAEKLLERIHVGEKVKTKNLSNA